ncbi:hypothetical protein AEQU3_02196 [Aequorivita antarctica]|nr:hypothetical protein AEQU3_02196 [Aequorivita antarctica]
MKTALGHGNERDCSGLNIYRKNHLINYKNRIWEHKRI